MRALLFVLDTAGIGHALDAAKYGDEGANTVGRFFDLRPDLELPNLCSVGLHELIAQPIAAVAGDGKRDRYRVSFGRMQARFRWKRHDNRPLKNRWGDSRPTVPDLPTFFRVIRASGPGVTEPHATNVKQQVRAANR